MTHLGRILKRVLVGKEITPLCDLYVEVPSYLSSTYSFIVSSIHYSKYFSTQCNDKVHKSVSQELLTDALTADDNSLISSTTCNEIESNSKSKNSGLKVLEKYNLRKCHITSFPPTFNFAAYINDSPSLQELVKLGVNLYTLEKRKGILQFILQRDFFRDMVPYIRFLHDVGVPADNLGMFLTMNPLIFKENLDDLSVRINYLESKNFTTKMISRIVTTNPYWLMFSTRRIDRRLGHFQKIFDLSGSEIRHLAVKQANVITYNMHNIKLTTFVLKEELGASDKELKSLLLRKPRLWIINNVRLKNRFEYAHLEMKIPHELILKNPEILTSREFRIKERHLFLKSLKRDQYDPTAEGYVSLRSLVVGSNADFAVNVAKASVDTFNLFLKSL